MEHWDPTAQSLTAALCVCHELAAFLTLNYPSQHIIIHPTHRAYFQGKYFCTGNDRFTAQKQVLLYPPAPCHHPQAPCESSLSDLFSGHF